MMNPIRRRVATTLGAGLGLGIAAPAILAQGSGDRYPSRPIKIIVPLAAGGGGDLTARQIAAELTERMGNAVVVENRPGAGGSLGTEIAFKSPPDGYTLVMLSSSYTCNAALRPVPYDPVGDIEPIALFKRESLVLLGTASLPVKNLRELIDRAKREPGKITYGSSGVGGITHLSMEQMASLAGIQLNHVAYKGTGPALQDTIAGTVQLMFNSIAPSVPMVQTKRVLGIAIADERVSAMPEVPSFAEAGLPAFKSGLWHAVAGPKGIPPEIVARLNGELNAILQSNAMKTRLSTEGSKAVGGPPDELMKTIVADLAQWKAVVQRAGIKAE